MSTRSFRSVFMVASCAGAALSCYLVSLRVASERAALEGVETRIVLAQRDLRLLQTEIGTRGRLAQLERWNVKVLALSAPSADQFLNGSFELARLAQPEHQVDLQAPVVLAAAPAPEIAKAPLGERATDESGAPAGAPSAPLLHEASLKTETREVPARAAVQMPPTAAPKSTSKPATAARPALKTAVDKPGLAAAQGMRNSGNPAKPAGVAASAKKPVDKAATPAAKSVTKPLRLAKTDPLAPLPTKHNVKSRGSSAER